MVNSSNAANPYGFHSASISEKPVINSETVVSMISRMNKLLESTSKASSLNPNNEDNKTAVETLKTCISACAGALKTHSEDMDQSVAESKESRNSFGR